MHFQEPINIECGINVMCDVWTSLASRRVPRSCRWKGGRQCKVDLIRGIWDVFKNELRSAATLTTAFSSRLNGQLAGRHEACQAAKYSKQHMNGRPDYFVTNDSLARAHAHGHCRYLWGQHSALLCVNCCFAIFIQWFHSQQRPYESFSFFFFFF